MTPAPNIKIKLHELNTILDEMEQGEAAVKKLAEMDASMGLQDPVDVARRMRGDNAPAPTGVQSTGDALGDTSLANNFRQQAEKMSREAQGLMAEAQRLLKEAAALDPTPVVAESKPKTRAKKETTAKAKKVNVA
jgi:hypothetical protein